MRTVAQIDASIAEFEAARDEIILLPERGTIGETDYEMGSGKLAQIENRLAALYVERAAALNGGRALRPRRGCC